MEENSKTTSVGADLAALGKLLEREIQERDCPEEEWEEMLEKLRRFREARTNIVLVRGHRQQEELDHQRPLLLRLGGPGRPWFAGGGQGGLTPETPLRSTLSAI